MSEWGIITTAYLVFGVWWAWGGVMRASRDNAHLGTPGEVGAASAITLIVVALGWPYWDWKWRRKYGVKP